MREWNWRWCSARVIHIEAEPDVSFEVNATDVPEALAQFIVDACNEKEQRDALIARFGITTLPTPDTERLWRAANDPPVWPSMEGATIRPLDGPQLIISSDEGVDNAQKPS